MSKSRLSIQFDIRDHIFPSFLVFVPGSKQFVKPFMDLINKKNEQDCVCYSFMIVYVNITYIHIYIVNMHIRVVTVV